MWKVHLKCVILGDGAIGKSALLFAYENNFYYEDQNIPPYYYMEYNQEEARTAFWDYSSLEDYMRTLYYPPTDVFLLCFSLSCQSSYENIIRKWYPEVTLHCPNVPIILVGTKLDLRDNERTHSSFITTEEGIKLSKDIGAVRYMECSPLLNQGVTEVIEAVVEVGIQLKKE